MRRFPAIAVLIVFATIGCAQVPQPTPPPSVSLSCTAASNATGYIFSRAMCTNATGCPANSPGNTAFTALNTSTPATTCSYTDAPPVGFVIYTVSAINNTTSPAQISQPSAPSNGGVPLNIPASPGTPGSPTATQSAMLAPPLVDKAKPTLEVAGTNMRAINLVAKVGK
jgi:hypothetical protein